MSLAWRAAVGAAVVSAVGLVVLPLASGYAVFLVPSSLPSLIGPTWYFALVSLLAGGAVGAAVAAVLNAVLKRATPQFFAAVAATTAATYLAFALYARGGVSGPGWWTPLSDAAAFLVLFSAIALVATRRKHAVAI